MRTSDLEWVQKFAYDLWTQMNKSFEKEHQGYPYISDLLLLSSEFHSISLIPDQTEKLGYLLCREIKEMIEKSNYYNTHFGMHTGLGKLAFCVNSYFSTTGHLKKFSSSVNSFLLEKSLDLANALLKKSGENTFSNDYDAISGMSGILYYLSDFFPYQSLTPLILYLIQLTKNHFYKGNEVINFHIPKENQFREDEKINFPNGNFNFGVAHGMMGALIALSKIYSFGCCIQGIKDAIEILLQLYDQYEESINGISVWPTQLSFEDYEKGKASKQNLISRGSWCYGNLGLSRGLYKVSQYLDDDVRKKAYQQKLIAILNQPITDYHVYQPVLCHGIPSVITIRMVSYWNSKNNQYLENCERDYRKIIQFVTDNGTIQSTEKIVQQKFQDNFTILEGAPGMCLSLLYVTNPDMVYSHLLMMD